MDNFDSLISLIQADVPSCPKVKLKQALRRTVREFCRGTRIWKESTREYLPAELHSISLHMPEGAELLELRAVMDGRRSLLVCDEPPLPRGIGKPKAVGVGRDAGEYLLVFDLAPASDLELSVDAAFLPSLNGESIPHILASHWGEDLAAGATSYLLFQPGTSWGDPQRAQSFRAQFQNAISRARSQEARGMAQSNQSVQMRRW